MNRKFEDKLAELAFGDLSPEEAGRLERSAAGDPEAQRTLSMYRDMKAGLKGLAEVPEDQFSKERLRDAILTQGLKPVAPRPTSSRAWLWMPCAALLIGFGYTVVRQNMRASAPPEIVMGPASIKGTALPTNPDPIRVAVANPPAVTSLLAPRGTETDRHADRSRNNDDGSSDLLASIPTGEGGEEFGYNNDSSGIGANGLTAGESLPKPDRLHRGSPTPPANSSAAHSGPVVLIEQVKDEQTGAEDATEVSSLSNVLVGG